MGKKRGRPKEVNSRGNIRKTRMSDEEAFILKRMCERESLTTSEALRLGVKALIICRKMAVFIVSQKIKIMNLGIIVAQKLTMKTMICTELLWHRKSKSELLWHRNSPKNGQKGLF